jgi:hypothetical protein
MPGAQPRWKGDPSGRSDHSPPNLTHVILCHGRLSPVAGLLAMLALAGCGGDGDRDTRTDEVRDAALAYVQALKDGRWGRACRLMTATARRELVGDTASESCAGALASGGTLPEDQLAAAGREVAGARVRIRGTAATIGPLGAFPQPLRLERVADRWVVAG